jgi:hypothetical protein
VGPLIIRKDFLLLSEHTVKHEFLSCNIPQNISDVKLPHVFAIRMVKQLYVSLVGSQAHTLLKATLEHLHDWHENLVENEEFCHL